MPKPEAELAVLLPTGVQASVLAAAAAVEIEPAHTWLKYRPLTH